MKSHSISCDHAPASLAQDPESCSHPSKEALSCPSTSHIPPPTRRTQESSKPDPKHFFQPIFATDHNNHRAKGIFGEEKKEDLVFTHSPKNLSLLCVGLLKDYLIARTVPNTKSSTIKESEPHAHCYITWICQVIK